MVQNENHLAKFSKIRLFYKNVPMLNNKGLQDYGVFDDPVVPTIEVMVGDVKSEQSKTGIEFVGSAINEVSKEMKSLRNEIEKGLKAGYVPELTFEGSCGTYFLKNDKRNTVAVFKPVDEEANAPNNPRNLAGIFGSACLKPGILSGEAAVREVSAYILDRNGFSGVPETYLAEVKHPNFKFDLDNEIKEKKKGMPFKEIAHLILPESYDSGEDNKMMAKVGSLQRFVRSDDCAENLGENLFDDE